MDYLTNYYKNLSEQLQEQVNNLEALLNEAFIRSPKERAAAFKKRNRETSWDYDAADIRRAEGRDAFPTDEELARRTKRAGDKRQRQLKGFFELVKYHPEHSDLFHRFARDMGVIDLKALGMTDTHTPRASKVGEEEDREHRNRYMGRPPERAERRPGAEPNSGMRDRLPFAGGLTPSELRDIVTIFKKHRIG